MRRCGRCDVVLLKPSLCLSVVAELPARRIVLPHFVLLFMTVVASPHGARQCMQSPMARQVAANVQPSLVIFVMDGSIGQAAFDQAKAFKDAVEVRGRHCCLWHLSCGAVGNPDPARARYRLNC